VGVKTDGEKAGGIQIDIVCKHRDRPTPCLDFHIQKCSAPCDGRRTPEQYFKESIEGVIRFLKGDYESVRPLFEERMKKAVAEKKFELAAQFRDNIAALKKLQGKQLISDTSGEDSDIIAVVVLSGRADVTVMQRRGGKLIGDQFFSLSGNASDPAGVLEQFLPQYYGDGSEVPDQIIVSEEIAEKGVLEEWFSTKKGKKVHILLPERGRKSHLLQLAEKNVREKARQREAKWEAEKRNVESALQELQSALDLSDPPARIEGYDISHLGGTETVGSMSVMTGGKPRSDQYRSFTLRSLKKGEVDDYKALKEVLKRRLRHLLSDLGQEEREWKKKGITFGKMRKAEQKRIVQLHEEHYQEINNEDIDFRRYLVARKNNDAIIGFCRTVEHAGGYKELKSLWVHSDSRGQKLGQFLVRKLLSMQKNTKKVYIAAKTSLVEYYEELGFRHVDTPPGIIVEKHHKAAKKKGVPPGVVMVYIFAEHKEDASLGAKPDLLVIDGGKGQLGAVQDVLAELKLNIPVIGLAKREEQVFMSSGNDPDAAEEISFAADSPAKFLLMRLRDEAHRFANRHREGRGAKAAQATILDEIPAIGPETRKKLLRKFGSVSGIREAADAELLEVLSESQLRELRKKL
jgi:excinuclease UvrABC nuclease subunit/N-acetylglutamate synthase-like GNAT family acetyltransferase